MPTLLVMIQTSDIQHEYFVSGGWGDAINWLNPEKFSHAIDENTRFDVTGWKRRIPEVGDILKGEFEKSWMWFRFVEVRPCYAPPDMFFGVVVPIRQEEK